MKYHEFLLVIVLVTFAISCGDESENENAFKTYFDYPGFVEDGLVAYYPMNENVSAGSDLTGNYNNGTIGAGGPLYTFDRFQKNGGALFFDGDDDFIDVSNATLPNSDRGTICFWVLLLSPDDEPVARAVLSKGIDYGFVISNFDNHFAFTIRDANSSFLISQTIGTINWSLNSYSDNRFVFVAVTFDDHEIRSYFNGELSLSFTYPIGVDFNSNLENLLIGKNSTSFSNFTQHFETFKGRIDDLLVYSRVLTDTEISTLYEFRQQ